MTKKERTYLRSAYHHYENRIQKSSKLLTDYQLLIDFVNASMMMKEITFLVLSLEGDFDGQSEEHLTEIFNEEGIKLMD